MIDLTDLINASGTDRYFRVKFRMHKNGIDKIKQWTGTVKITTSEFLNTCETYFIINSRRMKGGFTLVGASDIVSFTEVHAYTDQYSRARYKAMK